MHRYQRKYPTVFFYVGPPKEDIFFDHLLWSVFQLAMHIYFTDYNFFVGPLRAAFMYCINSFVLVVGTPSLLYHCIVLCLHLIQSCLTIIHLSSVVGQHPEVLVSKGRRDYRMPSKVIISRPS